MKTSRSGQLRIGAAVLLFVFVLFTVPALALLINGQIGTENTWQFPQITGDGEGDFFAMRWLNLSSPENHKLEFSRWDGANWIVVAELPDVVGGRQGQVAFAVDGRQHIHVAAVQRSTGNLHYWEYDGAWSQVLISSLANPLLNVDLQLGASGSVHVAYSIDDLSAERHRLYYTNNAAGSWKTPEVVKESTNRGDDEIHDLYLALSGSGVATVIYRRENNGTGGLHNYYLATSEDSFAAESLLLDGQTDLARYRIGDAAVDANDALHLVYTDETNSTAYYMSNTGATWTTVAIDLAGETIVAVRDISLVSLIPHVRTITSGNEHVLLYRSGESWLEDTRFILTGETDGHLSLVGDSLQYAIASEESTSWTSHYLITSADRDGLLIEASTISEPVVLPRAVASTSPVDILDFSLEDQGTSDGLSLAVKQLSFTLAASGAAHEENLRFNLAGCATSTGAAALEGVVIFSGLDIDIDDGQAVSCRVQAYWVNGVTGADGETISLSINGSTDVWAAGAFSTMSPLNGIVSTGTMIIDTVADRLKFTTQPAGSVSGAPLATQPVVSAVDAAGNVDDDASGLITLTTTAAGTLSNTTASMINGVAAFSTLTYSATADHQPFTLDASTGEGFQGGTSATVISDVVATKLVYTSSPAGIVSGKPFTGQPVVEARDSGDILDLDFAETITISSSAGSLSNNTKAAQSGVAAFTGLTYTATADKETFTLRSDDDATVQTDLPAVTSTVLEADVLATRLVFTTEPSPLSVINGEERDFTVDPVVTAVDEDGLTDVDFNDTISLGYSGTGSGTSSNNISTAIDGVATFSGLRLTYTVASTPGSFSLVADDANNGTNGEGDLPAVESASLVVDNRPPAPSRPDLAPDSDSGVFDDDNITHYQQLVFSGTAQPFATITLRSTTLGVVGSGNSDENGNWQITSIQMAEGNHLLSATATDLVGTSQPSDQLAVTIDLTAPTQPAAPDLAADSDTGESGVDNITREVNAWFSGQAEPLARVTLISSVLGICGAGTADAAGNWRIVSAALSDGTHAFTATAADAAGNISPASLSLAVEVDTAPPFAPSSPDLLPEYDSGISSSDDRTNVMRPYLAGTAEGGARVILRSSLAGEVGSSVAEPSGVWLIETTSLPGGDHTVYAQAVDVAGNRSALSAGLGLLIDITPPVFDTFPRNKFARTASKTEDEAVVEWLEPTAIDNVDGEVPVVQSSGLSSGASFPVGKSIVSYSAVDNQGNSISASFTVMVAPPTPLWWDVLPMLMENSKRFNTGVVSPQGAANTDILGKNNSQTDKERYDE